jgi:hypothetical protein
MASKSTMRAARASFVKAPLGGALLIATTNRRDRSMLISWA